MSEKHKYLQKTELQKAGTLMQVRELLYTFHVTAGDSDLHLPPPVLVRLKQGKAASFAIFHFNLTSR